ncbi:unnamed protein product [Leuciscus chuanchicus]
MDRDTRTQSLHMDRDTRTQSLHMDRETRTQSLHMDRETRTQSLHMDRETRTQLLHMNRETGMDSFQGRDTYALTREVTSSMPGMPDHIGAAPLVQNQFTATPADGA